MRIKDVNGVLQIAYKTMEEAIASYEFSEEQFRNEEFISLGIGKDPEGFWFVIDDENRQTNCLSKDLANWQDWFDESWIDIPRPDFAWTFEGKEEFKSFCERYRNDKKAHFFFGKLEDFEGKWQTLAEIKKLVNEPFTIYEWD